MKIAVTAASGALGTAILKQLISEAGPENVVAIARSPEKIKIKDIDCRQVDYSSKADFLKALTGIDTVILISANTEPAGRVQLHRNVIEATKESGVKRLIYTSIIGSSMGTPFDTFIQTNRQTEEDIKQSGLNWIIGRNGLYINADLDYIDTYKKLGKITNCAGNGKCSYTSRAELAVAYTAMALSDQLDNHIYRLVGGPITQQQLANAINRAYSLDLRFETMTDKDYLADRQAEAGEFMGTIVAGIYQGIRQGMFDSPSDFDKVNGRRHKTIDEMIRDFRTNR